MTLLIKDSPANAGDVRDVGLISGLGRSPGGRYGNPPQYSYLENPMDRGAWRAMVHRVTKSWTVLKQLSTHACTLKEETSDREQQISGCWGVRSRGREQVQRDFCERVSWGNGTVLYPDIGGGYMNQYMC